MLDYDLFYNDLNWETMVKYLEKKLKTFDFEKFAYFAFEESLYNEWGILASIVTWDIINSKQLSSRVDIFKIYNYLHKKYPEK